MNIRKGNLDQWFSPRGMRALDWRFKYIVISTKYYTYLNVKSLIFCLTPKTSFIWKIEIQLWHKIGQKTELWLYRQINDLLNKWYTWEKRFTNPQKTLGATALSDFWWNVDFLYFRVFQLHSSNSQDITCWQVVPQNISSAIETNRRSHCVKSTAATSYSVPDGEVPYSVKIENVKW